jgi:hypothetical protein
MTFWGTKVFKLVHLPSNNITIFRIILQEDLSCSLILLSTVPPFQEREPSLYKEFCLLGYNAVYSVEKQPTLRRNMWAPSSGSTCYLLHANFLLGLFPDPKDGGDMPYVSSVDFQWTTRCNIPGDRTRHKDRCENHKSDII